MVIIVLCLIAFLFISAVLEVHNVKSSFWSLNYHKTEARTIFKTRLLLKIVYSFSAKNCKIVLINKCSAVPDFLTKIYLHQDNAFVLNNSSLFSKYAFKFENFL